MTPVKTPDADPTPEVAASATTQLPDGVKPLWKQPQLEEYYGVSNWTVNQWIQRGCPIEPTAFHGRRFDIDKVRAWMADNAKPRSA
jgi:hypothetical protein